VFIKIALRRRFAPLGGLEPLEAIKRTGQQHERKPAARIPIPAHLQSPSVAQP
jgi:hypothetical protein